MTPAAAPELEKTATIALVGAPNSGKTTLFNGITGLRQKVANYPGVTVEKKEGWLNSGGRLLRLLDLPGIYSLEAQTPEELVACSILSPGSSYERRPDALLVVLDGSALERSLALFASLTALGLPMACVLTMSDEIKARGGRLDEGALAEALGVPVAAVVGHRGIGLEGVLRMVDGWKRWPVAAALEQPPSAERRYGWAIGVLARSFGGRMSEDSLTRRIDRWVLHPLAGPALFLLVMGLFFQSIFSWAQPLMEALSSAVDAAGVMAAALLPAGIWRGAVVDGLIRGVGSVVVFLPQIMILFFLLFLLEDVGYMPRAAFLMDRIMGWAGLQGRCFVALLSSYACAVPGIMATRSIPSPQDRLATILVAPFMTCSARLPVYALLIGAFVPDRPVLGPMRSQGVALLSLYLIGSASAFAAAWLLRSKLLIGDATPFYIELPPYRFPSLKSVSLAMLDRAKLFLRRAGTMILAASLGVWFLLHFPRPPQMDSLSPDARMQHSLAGRIGKALEPVFAPLGFDWRINVTVLGSLVAREMAVSTLAQIYAVEVEQGDAPLRRVLREGRGPDGRALMTPATALALLAFFIYALQCTSTLAVIRRETNGWRWPAFAFAYMLACAWIAGSIAYRVGAAMGWS